MKKEYLEPAISVTIIREDLLNEVITPGPDSDEFDSNKHHVFEEDGNDSNPIWSDYGSDDE